MILEMVEGNWCRMDKVEHAPRFGAAKMPKIKTVFQIVSCWRDGAETLLLYSSVVDKFINTFPMCYLVFGQHSKFSQFLQEFSFYELMHNKV